MRLKRKQLARDITRAEFLNMTALTAFATTILPWETLSAKPISAEPAKIGLQLYTVRDQIKEDIAGTLNKIAGFGFEAVETAFWPEGISVKQAGKYLKDAGLAVCSSHVELPVGEQKNKMLEIAETFNSKRMIWHGWPEDKRYSSLDHRPGPDAR